jgi:hypothetical protein
MTSPSKKMCLSLIVSPSKAPLHCQLRSSVTKLHEQCHAINKTFAALQTWSVEGDLKAINRECADQKIKMVSEMLLVCADLVAHVGCMRSRVMPWPMSAVSESLTSSSRSPQTQNGLKFWKICCQGKRHNTALTS